MPQPPNKKKSYKKKLPPLFEKKLDEPISYNENFDELLKSNEEQSNILNESINKAE